MHSEITRQRIGDALRKPVWFNCDYCGKTAFDRPSHFARKKRHFCNQSCYSKFREEKMQSHEQPTWRGGITRLTQIGRGTKRYKQWQRAVLERDGRKCISCGTPERLEADHIKPWAKFPELRFDVSNGRTLCVKHHSRKKNDENPELVKA